MKYIKIFDTLLNRNNYNVTPCMSIIDNVDNSIKYNKELFITDYIQTNLVMHFDGIQNTSTGHSNSTNTWYDLIGNGYDMIHTGSLIANKYYWKNNAFTIEKDGGLSIPPLWYTNKTFPTTGNDYLYWTAELIVKVTNDTGYNNALLNTFKLGSEYDASYDHYSYGYVFGKGDNGYIAAGMKYYQSLNGVSQNSSNIIYIAEYLEFPYVSNTNNIKTFFYCTNDGLISKTSTLNNFSQYTYGSFAVNFSRISLFGDRYTEHDIILPNTPEQNNESKITIYACRLYNRQLTQEEILHNARIDASRFEF